MSIKIILEETNTKLNQMPYEDWLKLMIATYTDAKQEENDTALEERYNGMAIAFKMSLITLQNAIKCR